MIQAPLPKPIELPKAQPKRADAEVVSNQKQTPKAAAASKKNEVSSAKEGKKEVTEFDKELENASSEVSGEAQTEVKAVQVSEDLELPSKLVNPNGSVDTTSPKIFDPSITKDVEKLIQPKSADGQPVVLTDEQVAQLATGEVDPKMMNAELEQAMLKTPKTASGRAPAIDFAKAEVDPQLLNNEDFVAQKNMAGKKAAPNAYGMKVVPQTQQQKVALENGLQQSQVVKEASANESAMNSQQFILGLQTEQKTNLANETQAAPVKTFDMSNIKSSQPTEIMNQITDYVVQAKAAKEPTVNMRVNHDELGMIDITVSRVGLANADTIAINIGAHTADGKNFFQQNSKELFTHLSNAGMNVSDLKVETPAQTAKNDFDFGSQSGRNGQGSEKQFGSEQNQRRHDQDRRQDLWKLLSKEAA
jgi:hypothetical protein